jgi:hypothetical protein
MVARLQEEVQKLQELLTALADLASSDTIGQDIDRFLSEPPAPSLPEPPAPSLPPPVAVALQLPVAQPIQHAARLSNCKQLALV